MLLAIDVGNTNMVHGPVQGAQHPETHRRALQPAAGGMTTLARTRHGGRTATDPAFAVCAWTASTPARLPVHCRGVRGTARSTPCCARSLEKTLRGKTPLYRARRKDRPARADRQPRRGGRGPNRELRSLPLSAMVAPPSWWTWAQRRRSTLISAKGEFLGGAIAPGHRDQCRGRCSASAARLSAHPHSQARQGDWAPAPWTTSRSASFYGYIGPDRRHLRPHGRGTWDLRPRWWQRAAMHACWRKARARIARR